MITNNHKSYGESTSAQSVNRGKKFAIRRDFQYSQRRPAENRITDMTLTYE